MASFVETGTVPGFPDKRIGRGGSASVLATPVNYSSVAAMETRLTALGYSAARLQQMNRNDMVYALRAADDAAGVK